MRKKYAKYGKWLGHEKELPFDTLLQIRKDMLEKIETVKREAEERERIRKEKESKKTGILSETGEEIIRE